MKTFRILIIEDDQFRTAAITEQVRKTWDKHNFDFLIITTEKDFKRRFDEIANADQNLAIIDQIIAYTITEDESSIDEETLALDGFQGGKRCFEMLGQDVRTKDLPVIFYTILANDRVPPNAVYVQKTGNPRIPNLLAAIGKALKI